MNFTTTRFIDEIYDLPFWLSVDCTVGGSCMLTRTLDINHDGRVNVLDLATVAGHLGETCSTGCPIPLQQPYDYTTFCSPACEESPDITGPNGYPDGVVNVLDLALIAQFFGSAASSAEPTGPRNIYQP
jgi:hypothetical protein